MFKISFWRGVKYIQFGSAIISFDWLPSETAGSESVFFGRDIGNFYTSLVPILFLTLTVISLWCASSIKNIPVMLGRITLFLAYVGLLSFYMLSSTFLMSFSVFGTILAANYYVWFAVVSILLFSSMLIWLRGLTLNLLLYSGGMTIFAVALVSSVDLISFYVCFEALSLLTYGVIATNKTAGSSEGALKYFIYGVISSVLLIFGLSLYYITYQSVDWYEVTMSDSLDLLGMWDFNFGLLAFLCIILAFVYKLSMFPFHFSLPDVYEGVNWETIAIINLVVKLALALSLFKIWGFIIVQIELVKISAIFLLILAIMSLIIGCFGALVQTTMKRLFAYTSINQAGFIVLGLVTNGVVGLQASLVYLVFYMLTMFIFFTGITLDNLNINGILELNKLSIMAKILVALSLFSMAGIPPFFGFLSKYWIWFALVNTVNNGIGDWFEFLLLIGFIVSIIVSLVSAYYYLRLIKTYMFGESINISVKFVQLNSIAVLLSLLSLLFLMGGWFVILEELINLFGVWARDNYGSWIDYLYTGRYREWLRF